MGERRRRGTGVQWWRASSSCKVRWWVQYSLKVGLWMIEVHCVSLCCVSEVCCVRLWWLVDCRPRCCARSLDSSESEEQRWKGSVVLRISVASCEGTLMSNEKRGNRELIVQVSSFKKKPNAYLASSRLEHVLWTGIGSKHAPRDHWPKRLLLLRSGQGTK